MHNYNLISYPRSGQHLTERLLISICKYFNQPYSYCEFYNCCRTIPCIKNSRFMKNHDFGFDYEIKPDQKYIVLYRTNVIQQLESYFRISMPFQKTFNYLEDHLLYSKLLKFIQNKLPIRDRFLKKWVTDNNENNILKINYDDIIKNPHNYLNQLLTFMEIKHTNNDILNILASFEKITYLNKLPLELLTKIKSDLNKPIINKNTPHGRFSKHSWKLF